MHGVDLLIVQDPYVEFVSLLLLTSVQVHKPYMLFLVLCVSVSPSGDGKRVWALKYLAIWMTETGLETPHSLVSPTTWSVVEACTKPAFRCKVGDINSVYRVAARYFGGLSACVRAGLWRPEACAKRTWACVRAALSGHFNGQTGTLNRSESQCWAYFWASFAVFWALI